MPVDIESENSTAIAMSGKRTRFIATVSGDIDPETEGYIIPQGVVWEISDFGESDSLAMGTFIDPEGVLHVDRDEQNSFVRIKATSTVNSDESGTLDVGINEEYTPSDDSDFDASDYPVLNDATIHLIGIYGEGEQGIIMVPPLGAVAEGDDVHYQWDVSYLGITESDPIEFIVQGNFSKIVLEDGSGLSWSESNDDSFSEHDYTFPFFLIFDKTESNTDTVNGASIRSAVLKTYDVLENSFKNNYIAIAGFSADAT